jgi:hypothetical protein
MGHVVLACDPGKAVVILSISLSWGWTIDARQRLCLAVRGDAREINRHGSGKAHNKGFAALKSGWAHGKGCSHGRGFQRTSKQSTYGKAFAVQHRWGPKATTALPSKALPCGLIRQSLCRVYMPVFRTNRFTVKPDYAVVSGAKAQTFLLFARVIQKPCMYTS